MRKLKTRILSLLLAALMLLSVQPVSAATASTIRLTKTTGTVAVVNSSGRSVSKWNNMLLYNGYSVRTAARSYAWINLDSAKLGKLDASSKVSVRKSGSKLETRLIYGHLYFNVSSPLTSGETLNIRTSTMAVGVRGTCGIVKVIDRWATEIYILEGTVQVSVDDPVTGQVKTATLHSGDKAIATAYPQDKQGDKCDILMERFDAGDIDGFVLEELVQDPELCADIYEKSGIDVLPRMGLLESIRRQLEDIGEDLTELREQLEDGSLTVRDAQSLLDGIRQQLEEIKEQLEQAGPDAGTQRRLEQAQELLEQAQEALDAARSREALDRLDEARETLEDARGPMAEDARQQGEAAAQERLEQDERELQDKLDKIEEEAAGQEHNVSQDPVWEQQTTPPGGGGSDSSYSPAPTPTPEPTPEPEPTPDPNFRMYMTAGEVQAYLDEHGAGDYILLASETGVPADNLLTVDTDMIIPSGTTLNLDDGIDVTVSSGGSLTVNGTLSGGGTLINNGALTVNSSNSLKMSAIVNNNVLTNSSGGRIVADTLTSSSGAFTNAGTIEGSVAVTGGTFSITGGKILSEGDDPALRYAAGGTLDLAGSTVTNGGSGYAVLAESVDAINLGNAVIRAQQRDRVIGITDSAWVDLNTSSGGDTSNVYEPYYTDGGTTWGYCVAADGGSYCYRTEWTFDGSTLTVGGSGPMGNYTAGAQPWDRYIWLIETVLIGDGVTSIGTYAFYNCTNLTSVTIPSSVASIGASAFNFCEDLASVTIPGSVKEIGSSAFATCYGLSSLTISDGVEFIGDSSFFSCDRLTDVEIPGSVKEIGSSAFATCYGLSSLTISDGVEFIGDSSFFSCDRLTDVEIPGSVKEIGSSAFLNCRGLSSLTISNGVEIIGPSAFMSCVDLTSVVIPGSVTEIGANAFWECDSLRNLTISNGVERIGVGTFAGCTGLTSVTIPPSVTSIGRDAFSGSGLTSVTLPNNSRVDLGEEAFSDCPLTALSIPSGVVFGLSVFERCESLTSVTFLDGCTDTGAYTFMNCSGLTSVTFPDGFKTIGQAAFEMCSGLISVTIPASVTTIDQEAFLGCDALTDVYYGGNMTQWGSIEGEGAVDLRSKAESDEITINYNSTGPNDTAGGSVLSGGASAETDDKNPFTDVADTAWYSDAVQYVYAHGLMDGTGGGMFSPDRPTSRAMIVTILHRMEGRPDGSAKFPDVPASQWYAAAVAWAGANGIVNGYENGLFRPNDHITREQLAAILYRYAVYKGYDTKTTGSAAAFPDGDRVSAYAADAVNWAVGTGLLQGSGNQLSPAGGAVRAQAATILMRFCENVARDYTLTVVSAMDTMCEPSGILPFDDGSFLVTDTYNQMIWKVDGNTSTAFAGVSGESSVYAGGDTVKDPFDRPLGGYNDAELEKSYFKTPWAIVPFLDGYAVSDADNNVVRLVRTETTQTVNGTTKENLTVTKLGVAFDHPTGLAADGEGNLYVSDTFAGAVRKITPKGQVTTFAKGLEDPMGLCWKDGTLYIAETGANRIVKTTGGQVTVVAGSGEDDFIDGPAAQAAFSGPQGVAVGEDGTVYVSDTVNGAVRQIRSGAVTTLARRDIDDLTAFIPDSPVGLMVRGSQLFVCDSFARKVFVIPL